MKHLIQILLPLIAHDPAQFEKLARELTEKLGGVTSIIRAPAEGRWQSGEKTELDDIAVIEVMTGSVDRAYWANLRQRLEQAFAQEEIVVRCQPLELL
jgi:hypothetical protein